MTVTDIMRYFKQAAGWEEKISVGKIDKNAERAVCFYPSKRPGPSLRTVGGKANRSYDLMHLTILLRWGNTAPAAEEKANEIYNFFNELTTDTFFAFQRYDSPIPVGTDERGIYEFTMELDIYARKD